MSHLLITRRLDPLQRVRDAEFLILIYTQCMIRQDIYALDVGERIQETAQLLQIFILIGYTGNQNMSNPYGLVYLAEIAGTIEYVLIAMKRQLAMLFIIDMLDIKKNGIGDGHQTLEFLEEFPFFPKRLSRGIKTGVDAALMRLLKQFYEKIYLHQGFSAAHGDAALVAPIALESLCLIQQVIGTPLFSYPCLPGIRIVAELAAHGTTLQKDQKTDAWSIY